MTKHWFAAALAVIIVSFAEPASAAVIVITQSKALAGNVTPGDTAGFPVDLSQAGVYRFDSNLGVTADRDGIRIGASGVTIDMGGFRMHGHDASNNGILGTFANATIRNGTITGFKFDGIHISGDSLLVENLRIVLNGQDAIYAPDSEYARIINNTVAGNTGFSGGVVLCGFACHVEGNVVADNLAGIDIKSGTVLGNTIISNDAHGIFNEGVGSDVGFGNNTIIDNTPSVVGGAIVPLQPNACNPACP